MGYLNSYDWLSRTAFRHRREILDFIGIRRVSAADKVKFSTWLAQSVYPRGVDAKEATELAFDRYTALPEGYSFRVQELEKDLILRPTSDTATVMQDEFENTFDYMGDGSSNYVP
mgnify:CR=1 FL=1